MFNMLFHIHGRPPQSIITDDQSTIALAIELLRENRFYDGAHLLDPWHILKVVKKDIPGDNNNKCMRLAEIMEAMMERNEDDYDKEIQKLQENPDTAEVIEKLLARKHRIFYCYVQAVFIGLRRNSAEPINNIIKSQIPYEVNF